MVLVEHLRAPRPDRADPRSSSTTARRAPSRCRCGSSGTRATPASCARADRPRVSRRSATARAASPSSTRSRSSSISSAFAFAELVLDRLQLLAQVVLPLRVGHLLLRRRFDLALHLEQRDLARRAPSTTASSFAISVVCFEDLLLLVGFHVEQARQQIGQPQRIVDAARPAPRSSCDSPLASDSARSTSSCRRRT